MQKRRNFAMTQEHFDRIKEEAKKQHGGNISAWMRWLLDNYFKVVDSREESRAKVKK